MPAQSAPGELHAYTLEDVAAWEREPNSEVVITHREHGIYVGEAMGFGFWSMMDAAGQDTVPTFLNEEKAREYVAAWGSENDHDAYSYVQVSTDPGSFHANVEQLTEAGLEDMLGELRINVPTFGNA